MFCPFEEAEPRQLADNLPIDRGLRGEVELLKRFQPRESRLFEWALGPVLIATTPFDVERLGERRFVVEVPLACSQTPSS